MPTVFRSRAVKAIAPLALAAGLVVAVPTARATVVFNESINGELGDLVDFGSPSTAPGDPNATLSQDWTTLGTLTTGTSTVLGSSHTSFINSAFVHDGDAIRFTIPTGDTITGLTITNLNPGTGANIGLRQLFALNAGGTDIGTPNLVPRTFPPAQPSINGSGVADLLAQYNSGNTLGPGSYVLSLENITNGGTLQYQIDITVIPTPASGALAIIGLGVMLRRRRY